MSFELHRILQSKREYRQRFAARPIAEKLTMLDTMRERALAIRPSQPTSDSGALREEPVPYVASGKERKMKVRRTDLPWAEVSGRVQTPWRKELHRDFEHALAETKLPERPDYEKANNLLIKVRRQMANYPQR